MHVDEVDTDASLAGRLLSAQFPQWADLSIEPVHSAGTEVSNPVLARIARRAIDEALADHQCTT
jgi:hypothetical protein